MDQRARDTDKPAAPPAPADDALARGDWEGAADLYRAAIERQETAQAQEGLSWAAWWMADEVLTFEARIRAFQLYRAAGRPGDAARLAAWIAADFREFRGEQAAAMGWIRRAGSFLEGQKESANHGWVALLEADLALNFERDTTGALPLCEQAARIGREHGVSDLEAVGLAQGGVCHVTEGRVEEGMRCLDEAVAIASAGDLHLPITEGWAFCCLIAACDGIGDFKRTAEWAVHTRRFSERWGARQLVGVCRVSYGSVLATQGDWPAAEVELTSALDDLRSTRPGMASGGLARLGELRGRQGRDEEAAELFEKAGVAGQIGLGVLELDRGRPEQALAMAERALRRIPEPAILERLPAQELAAQSLLAAERVEEAGEIVAAIRETARTVDTPYTRARASLLAAQHSLTCGDSESGRRCAEDAVDGFQESSAPYDTAHARLQLARSLAAVGWDEQAEAERRAALRTFEELGAKRDAERAVEPLPSAEEAPTTPGADSSEPPELTKREIEVLRLVADGKGDAEIAEELVLSSHTVHRHVANIRTKLGQPSRAAAVAYAARQGLL